MATIIPSLTTIRNMTTGERRLGQRLESLLEGDYTVWYDIPVGKQRRYPDFIVLHPGRGLLFLEVKDWRLPNIKRISPERVTLETNTAQQEVSNPLEQARQYAYTAVNQLRRDPQLIENDGRFQGKLRCPYGYGVVFPNITRKQWNDVVPEPDQENLLPSHRVIFKDEMTSTADPEAFQSRLWAMFEYSFGDKLTLPQINRIRWLLFPEVRINGPQQALFSADKEGETSEPVQGTPTTEKDAWAHIPDIVRVMDIQQEQLAKSMGDGHRVIHGVAGSGKTLILGYRCLHLANALHKPILVLCFNITLAARLRTFLETKRIAEKGIADKVHVHHFHDWCGLQLKTYNVNVPPGSRPVYERQVESVIRAVDSGQIPRAQYGALMIDEGHDFEQEWLKLVVQMIDPDSNSLLLLYDDAQAIYSKQNFKFPLSSAGIQARGRTTILKLNYRNTREILTFAYEFAKDFLHNQNTGEDEDHVPLIAPEVAGASGPQPVFRQFETSEDEANYITRCIQKWRQQGQPLNGIAVVYAKNRQGGQYNAALKAANIPCRWLGNQQQKRAYNPDADEVTLLSRHSSKGLEFDTVILAGLGDLKNDEEQVTREMRLLYVGMTRARRQLLVTSGGQNWFTERLGRLMGEAA